MAVFTGLEIRLRDVAQTIDDRLIPPGLPMIAKKTLPEREKGLQSFLATPAGREQLRELQARYQASTGTVAPASASIT